MERRSLNRSVRFLGRRERSTCGECDEEKGRAMNMQVFSIRRGALLGAVTLAWLSASAAQAQVTPRLLVATDAKEAAVASRALLLRPNTVQTSFVSADNPGPTPASVVVEVLANGTPIPGAKQSFLLKAGEVKPIHLPALPTPPAPPGSPPPPPPP